MADLEQWVNVPKTEAFKKLTGAASLERLGPVNIKAKFKKANLAAFRVKIIPLDGAKHEKYSAAERGRNENFTVRVKGAATNTGKTSVELDKNIFLNAAGGNRYKIKAKYRKKEIESGLTVKSHRFLAYQRMHMKSVKSTDLASMEAAFWKPAKNYFIKLKEEGPDKPVKYIKTVVDNGIPFVKEMAKGWTLAQKYKPFAFGVAFVNYIATKREVVVTHKANITVPSKLRKWNWKASELTFSTGQWLWLGLDDTDDKNKHWLVHCVFRFKPADGGPVQALGIDRAWVTATGADRFAYGGKHEVKVKLDEKRFSRNFFTEMKGELFVELRIRTASWTNGFAYNQINLLAIADRVLWGDQPEQVKLNVINHEMGHKVGMVADGTGRGPDKPAFHYHQSDPTTDQNHTGNHCSNGAAFDSVKKSWSGAPSCVMFGADGITVSGTYKMIPADFCGECAPAVRKVDLGEDTLKAEYFKYSMDEF